jgi:hypothetical protein
MKASYRWQSTGAALLAAMALAACGGGGSGNARVLPARPTADMAILATQGFNWINTRRQQAGLTVLPRNSIIDMVATGHSDYQRLNGLSHEQEAGKPGFTGAVLVDRLNGAGYTASQYYYSEVISSGPGNSGELLAEELITAIYHRFAIFQPRYKEMGAGAAGSVGGANYLTINFTANNGYGPGIGDNVVVWPVDGQTGVVPIFSSDSEKPDPVSNIDIVGYPISVHVDVGVALTVSNFEIRPRGGSNLPKKLLTREEAGEEITMQDASGAAIVPLSPLAANTVYDVSFSGTIVSFVPGREPATVTTPVTRNWSFTTRP